ncbi:MAG: hypothetical protein SNH99_05280, partial [Rikenellaceae bacterium]
FIPFSGAKESFISLSSLKKYFISFPATFPIPQLHLQVEFRGYFPNYHSKTIKKRSQKHIFFNRILIN